jgi:single-strand DNA-binding protein
MKDVNKIILIGRLGADPVQRETQNGTPVVHFPLATSRKLRAEGEGEAAKTEETQWHRVVAWGKQGEACAQYLKKGQSVFVEGSVKTRKFSGKDGSSKIAFEVHAENVSFLSSGFKHAEKQSVPERAAANQ